MQKIREKIKSVAGRYWVRAVDTWRRRTERERESKRISLMVWSLCLGLLNDATSSQASQEEEFTLSLSPLCRPHLSSYHRACLLMSLSTPWLLCVFPLHFLMPWSMASWLLFIYGHALSACVGFSNIHLSCAATVQASFLHMCKGWKMSLLWSHLQ